MNEISIDNDLDNKMYTASGDVDVKLLYLKIKLKYLYLFLLILACSLYARMIYIPLSIPKDRITKEIKKPLKSAINSDCDFDDLKFIFDNKRYIVQKRIFTKASDYYEQSVNLSDILEDMVSDYYTDNSDDITYLMKLRVYINEAKDKHPFDKLNEYQKQLFVQLREKAGDNYTKISEDVIRISEELNERNEEISSHFSKSNASFYISLIAFVLTIFQLIYMFVDPKSKIIEGIKKTLKPDENEKDNN